MTTGTSLFGFETDQDRERKKLIESQKERALEARKRAREQKAVDLARLLDPVMREILADFLSASGKTKCSIAWDGKTAWHVGEEGEPHDSWFVRISVKADDRKGIYLGLLEGGGNTKINLGPLGTFDDHSPTQRLRQVFEEIIVLRVEEEPAHWGVSVGPPPEWVG